jgi:pilus assembly protein FimV
LACSYTVMNNFKKVSAVVLAGTALSLAPGVSHGLGFGRPSSHAVLGEKLQFQVPLRLEAGEDVTSDCLVGDVYLGDDKLSSASVSVTLQRGLTSETSLLVRTLVSVNEPVVTLYLVAGCQAKITRKFVVFVDPPGVTVPGSNADPLVTPADMAAVSLPPAPLAGKVASARRAAPKVARAALAAASSAAPMGSGAPRPAQAPTVPGQSMPGAAGKLATTLKPEAGGRLVLDPVEQEATVIPSLRMALALGAGAGLAEDTPQVKERRAAAAALWQALNASPEQMARDRLRLVELEQRLATLRKESEGARTAIDGLQGRAREAEERHAPNWLTAALLALLVAAVAVAAWLYSKLNSKKRGAPGGWWQGAAEAQDTGVSESADLSRTSVEFVHRADEPGEHQAGPASGRLGEPPSVFRPVTPAPTMPMGDAGHARATHTVAGSAMASSSPFGLHDSQPSAASSSANALSKPTRSEPLREVSVEELIDLEQQAEFFVVLGQDDAALDLLEGHVQSTTGASPLPFLKLLEMYQRLDRRGDYERVQSAFNERFNAYAPAWESDLQQGHTLVDYPGVVERLQALWAAPAHAMDVLEKSLTRPDNDAETFDLPAYRELLFLYAVARDLSEREAKDRDAVDLLLPVTDTAHVDPSHGVMDDNEVEPLMATRPVKAQPQALPSISLDLQLDDLSPPPAAQAPADKATPSSAIVTDNLPDQAGPIDFEHIDLPEGGSQRS